MYTVARFLNGFASEDEVQAMGAAMNALQDGVFTGPRPRGDGFACHVCDRVEWAEHHGAIENFIARFREPIAQMIGRGVSVTIDVAVDGEVIRAANVLVGLAVAPDLLRALGSAGITFAVSVYRALAEDDPPGDTAEGDGAPGGRAYDDSAPDLAPSQADLAAVGALAPSELDEIDRALLAAAGPRNRKVAMVVATVLQQFAARFPALPDVFYAQRIIRLVRLGKLEGYGDEFTHELRPPRKQFGIARP